MRKVVREDIVTNVQILEYAKGVVTELERMEVPRATGNLAMSKALKEAKKKYPKRNIFCGEVETGRFRYEMGAEEFMKVANKVEILSDESNTEGV